MWDSYQNYTKQLFSILIFNTEYAFVKKTKTLKSALFVHYIKKVSYTVTNMCFNKNTIKNKVSIAEVINTDIEIKFVGTKKNKQTND